MISPLFNGLAQSKRVYQAAFSTLKESQINVKREILTTHFSKTCGINSKLQPDKTPNLPAQLPALLAPALAKFAFSPCSRFGPRGIHFVYPAPGRTTVLRR